MDVKKKIEDTAGKTSTKVKAFMAKHFRSDDFDMYKSNDMDYRVKDSTYRDIYERGNEYEGDSTLFVTAIPMLVVGLILFFAVLLIPFSIASLNAQANGHFFKVLLVLYLMPMGGLIRGILLGVGTFGAYKISKIVAQRYWDSQHVDDSRELLDQYKDDSRIQQPEELPENFDIFPDVGAHSKGTDVTAIIGHMMLNNDGLDKVSVTMRADGKTDVDENGELLNKNVRFYDDNDEVAKVTRNMIDTEFGEKLWDSDDIPRPQGKNSGYIQNVLRRRYSPSKLLYNPMHKFGKPDVKTVSERINSDWYMPEFEVQRPAGCYIVDTEPNNTMVC